jgi:hypothetical protein
MTNTPSPKPAAAVKPKAAPQPRWWAPSTGLWFVVGFAALAGLPYLTSATRLMAAGKELSAEAVQKEMKSKEGEKKKEEMKKEDPRKLREIKSMTADAEGVLYAGGKSGVFALKGGAWSRLAGFTGHDVKSVAVSSGGELFVAHHDGVSMRSPDGAWSEVFEGEVHSVAAGTDGAVYLSRHKPEPALLQLQTDGTWSKLNDGLPLPQ